MSEFERALAKVLVYEGGYVNNPRDPGGETNKGVTKAVYDGYRKTHNLPVQSVKLIGTAELRDIYKSRYWDLFKGDEMPAGVSLVVFDGAVNSGVAQSVKWLQRALKPYYSGAIDGLVGPGTLAAIGRHPDKRQLIADICAQRLAFLKALKTWPTFGRGWSSRVADVQRTAQAWAAGVAAEPLPLVDDQTPKAPVTDVAAPPPVAPGDAAAGGGTVAAVISQTIGQLLPLQALPTVGKVIMWLTIAGAVIAIGGIAYRFWAAHRKAKIKAATT
jgi:lysozyme family protein